MHQLSPGDMDLVTGENAVVGEQGPALLLRGIFKSYGIVRVLSDVNFSVLPGEVHALVGENGAGKSTLMGIAGGVTKPDRGEVFIAGQKVEHLSPEACRARGLSVVFQDMSLAPDLTVAENLQLGLGATASGAGNVASWASDALAEFDTKIDPRTLIRDLTVASQQVVEIARALAAHSQVLILDEPTAALAANEVEHLFHMIRKVTSRGGAVVYITHRLPEVFGLAHRVSVLRDGEMISYGLDTADLTYDHLVELMIGRPVESVFPDRSSTLNGDAVVEVRDLRAGEVHGVTIEARRGEIVGFSGIDGNGQRECLRCLAGLETWSGSINISNGPIAPRDPVTAIRAGIQFVSSDRLGEALFPRLSVRENLTAGQIGPSSIKRFIGRRHEITEARRVCSSLSVRASSLAQEVASLSGGNQQKVAIGSALLSRASVYLIDEPTHGVDIGARATIYSTLRGIADAGKVVIVVSSDANELAQLCDRVYVFSRGTIIGELHGSELNADKLVELAVTTDTSKQSTVYGGDKNPLVYWARRSDVMPVAVISLVIFSLYVWGALAYDGFVSNWTLTNILAAAVPLGFVALAQAFLMLLGDLDLSVGPLMGLTTVAVVQIYALKQGFAGLALVVSCALGIGALAGLINGVLTQFARIPALMATLATFIAFQGVALIWLPNQGGQVPRAISGSLQADEWVVPWPFFALAIIAAVTELVYRKTQLGRWYRCVGSKPKAASRLGCNVRTVRFWTYVFAGVVTAVAGLFFSATIGIGSGTLANNFTLRSIAAVVLGGLSTWGGRGSIIGPVLGAVALAEIATLTSFMNAGPNIQLFVTGGLTLLAISVYSRLRGDAFRDEVVR